MRLLIDTSSRNFRKITIYSSEGKNLGQVEGQGDFFELFGSLMESRSIKLSQIKEIKAEMEGESRVGILIGVSAANALNYCLGLKKVEELGYPPEPAEGF